MNNETPPPTPDPSKPIEHLGDGLIKINFAQANKKHLAEIAAQDKIAAHLMQVVAKADVGGHPADIMAIDVISSHLRQQVTKLLKALDPPSYKKYSEIKYEGVPKGGSPSLEQRKAAYRFAFEKFLDVTYTKAGF